MGPMGKGVGHYPLFPASGTAGALFCDVCGHQSLCGVGGAPHLVDQKRPFLGPLGRDGYGTTCGWQRVGACGGSADLRTAAAALAEPDPALLVPTHAQPTLPFTGHPPA